MSADTANVLYAVAFFVMAAAAGVELHDSRRVSWPLLVSVSWAVVMFIWWQQ